MPKVDTPYPNGVHRITKGAVAESALSDKTTKKIHLRLSFWTWYSHTLQYPFRASEKLSVYSWSWISFRVGLYLKYGLPFRLSEDCALQSPFEDTSVNLDPFAFQAALSPDPSLQINRVYVNHRSLVKFKSLGDLSIHIENSPPSSTIEPTLV